MITFLISIIALGYVVSFLLFQKGKIKERNFKNHTLLKLNLITKSQATKIDYSFHSSNPMTERSFIPGGVIKYKSILSITQNELILHSNFSISRLSFPDHKSPIVLFNTVEDLNPSLKKHFAHLIKSINLNSFNGDIHIEAIYSESTNSTVTIKIKDINPETKNLIAEHFKTQNTNKL